MKQIMDRFKMVIIIASMLLICLNLSYQAEASGTLEAIPSSIPIIILGQPINPNPGVLVNDQIFLPLRTISSYLGVKVDFVSNSIIVTGEAQNVETIEQNEQVLNDGVFSAVPSPFPLYVNGTVISPNPGIIIKGRTYLPLRRLSDILGVAIDYYDGRVMLGEQTTVIKPLLVAMQPSAQTSASVTFKRNHSDYRIVSAESWQDEVAYLINSVNDLELLIKMMVANLGRTVYIQIDSDIVPLCQSFMQNYKPIDMENISYKLTQDGGVIYMDYAPLQEVTTIRNNDVSNLSPTGQILAHKINEIVSQEIRLGMSDFEKEKAIHDYLVRNVEYDLIASQNSEFTVSSTAYGALIMGEAVCVGYSEAFMLIMEYLNIECHIIHGKASGVIDHAWNLVKLDGEYYHIDVTWDDPVLRDSSGNRIPSMEPGYGFFNLTDQLMSIDHEWQRSAFPAATGSKYRLISIDYTLEEMLEGIDNALQRGISFYESRCVFVESNGYSQRDLVNIVAERIMPHYDYITLNVDGDIHGTNSWTFFR